MKDKKSMVMIIIIGITLSLFLCFNTTVFATTGTVTTNDLRLRKDKSTSSEILELLDENTEVEIISEDGDWCKIKSGNKVGYVSKQYIKVKDNNNTTKNEAKNETNSENKNTTTENVVNNTTTEQNNIQQNTTTENDTQAQNNTENQTQNNVTKIKQATVSEEVSIRIIPLINSDEINKTKSGEKYEVLSSVGAWSYVKNESKEGWVLTAKISVTEQTTSNNDENNTKKQDNNDTNTTTENNDVKADENKKEEDKKSEKTSKTYYVKGTSVNARSEANKSSSVVKKFDTNDKVTVTGEDGDWYIVDINGKKAYIQKSLLSSKKVETTSRSSNSLTENNEENNVEEQKEETTTETNKSADAIVAYAKTFQGYPYVYGSNGPSSFDCSGFVQYVYKHFGYSLSRSSKTQANDGVAVSKSNLQPGDILIFKNTAKTEIGHVGIYIGNGQFIHASNPKTGVTISSLSSASYQQRYVTARRIL